MEIQGISGEGLYSRLVYASYLAPAKTEEDTPDTTQESYAASEAASEAAEIYLLASSREEFLHRVDLLA